MTQKFEYKFVRLGEGRMYVGREARESYRDVVIEHAKDGWRLVQVFAPGIGGAGAGVPKYFEVILERST